MTETPAPVGFFVPIVSVSIEDSMSSSPQLYCY